MSGTLGCGFLSFTSIMQKHVFVSLLRGGAGISPLRLPFISKNKKINKSTAVFVVCCWVWHQKRSFLFRFCGWSP